MPIPSEMMDIERRNLVEIERLNQRGGRMLSVLELVEAGTISVEMVAFCRLMILDGTGWLTAAVPGGAGKTTIMAALLGLLPAGEPIVSVRRGGMPCEAPGGAATATMLAHEISPGPMYGYIWDQDVADFFASTRRGMRCVSCLHTDDPDETQDVLSSLGVAPEDLDRIRLQLYIHVSGRWNAAVRRVRSLHCRLNGRLRTAFRWREGDDSFERLIPRAELAARLAEGQGAGPEDVESLWQAGEQFIEQLLADGVRHFEDVRRAFFSEAPASGARPTC